MLGWLSERSDHTRLERAWRQPDLGGRLLESVIPIAREHDLARRTRNQAEQGSGLRIDLLDDRCDCLLKALAAERVGHIGADRLKLGPFVDSGTSLIRLRGNPKGEIVGDRD